MSSPWKLGISPRGFIAELIADIPIISRENPIVILQIVLKVCFFVNIVQKTATTARNGVKFAGLISVMMRLSPSMELRLSSHAVAVVPRFAPRITLTA